MTNLQNKINKSQAIIKQAYDQFKDRIAIAWTGGKDSTVLMHLVRSSFKNKIPFPVMFNDSTMEFEEVYDFIEKITSDWKINLTVVKHLQKDLKQFYSTPSIQKKMLLSRQMKINAINYALKKYKYAGFLVAIRKDEHSSRSKEKHFSPRKEHMRIHPVLHFTEKDIWNYIRKFKVPYVNLYDKGYRSLGEKPFTKPSVVGKGERSGRETRKEVLMKQLRDLGYW